MSHNLTSNFLNTPPLKNGTKRLDTLFSAVVKFSPKLLVAILILPVLGGLLGVFLPAFGWLPALDRTQFGLQGFQQLIQTPGIAQMIGLSFFSSIISGLLAFIMTILLLANYFDSPWLARIQGFLGPILVIPHAAAAIAIAFLITPSGMIARLLSPWLTGWQSPTDWLLPHDPYGISIIMGLTLKELPFLLLMTLSAIAQPDLNLKLRAQYRVALSLGYYPITAFFKAVLPNIYPFMRLPMLAILAYASASVEMPLILGPNTPPTLAVAIMNWFHDVDLSLRIKASAGAILQLFITLSVLLTWWLLEKTTQAIISKSLSNGQRTYGDTFWTKIINIFTLLLSCFITLALLGMVFWSFAGYWQFPLALPGQWVITHWQSALLQIQTPIINSLSIGLVATSIALILTLLTLEFEKQNGAQLSRFSSVIIYLPLMIPSIAFLFGLVWLQEAVHSKATFINVALTHLLFVLPYVFLSLATSYRLLDPRYAQVAAGLGASPIKIFLQVSLPQLLMPIMMASALGLAISFSQYLPTLLVSGGRLNTVTTEAVSLANGASRRTSAVYALIQMLLPAIAFSLIWLMSMRKKRQKAQAKRNNKTASYITKVNR
ncbi:ABC transporter permease [Colwellia sp. C1TZA3]|uniref:ABC transporter permease n=1 Tax=Colwellia sp. C1TZA3 TaxID=2508879 RepID=UPI0011BA2DC1|nr:ABC transporter permease subunit [Colwellia sp. C1TZA3]TWX73596.1 ABC transporter permease subunit [Colwellia sp. C1TZA3]